MSPVPARPRSALGIVVLLLVALACIVAVHSPSDRPVGSPRTLYGVVETSGIVASSRASGGTQVIATVRLDSGEVVQANVFKRRPLRRGARVRIHSYGTGEDYEVVGTLLRQ